MRRTLYLCLSIILLVLAAPAARAQTIGTHTETRDTICGSINLSASVVGCTSGMSVTVHWGDATTTTTSVFCSSGTGSIWAPHAYTTSGVYTIKLVLYSGTTAIDSVSYSYDYHHCQFLPLGAYIDANGNCTAEAGESAIYASAMVEVDSAGTVIDTISMLGGRYYPAYGPVGTTYTFRLITAPTGLALTCPTSGIVTITVPPSSVILPVSYFAFNCSSTSGFDLSIGSIFTPAITGARAIIWVYNSSCTGTAATVKMDFGPKYTVSAVSLGTYTVTGNSVSVNVGTVSATVPKFLTITFSPVGTLTLGDTVKTTYTVSPITGDTDPTNNTIERIDTIRAAYDPNAKSVYPSGNITAGTTLEYMLQFENTGNDSAHNIFIMDTLSNNLDISTLKVLKSSHSCFLSQYVAAGKNILKFNFPNIMLPEAAYPAVNKGFVTFSIKAKSTLTPGTVTPNRVGIYFDTNPVVLTNTVYSKIPLPGGVANAVLAMVELYPNPVTDVLTVQADPSFTTLSISNTIGQTLMTQPISTSGKVNVKSLPAGTYYITLQGAHGTKVQKFQKM